MKVARWYNNQDIRIEEAPTPKPDSREILVKVISSGICGSDIVESMKLIKTRTINVDDMITHRLPIKNIAEGFQLVIDGRESIKVIIKPNG